MRANIIAVAVVDAKCAAVSSVLAVAPSYNPSLAIVIVVVPVLTSPFVLAAAIVDDICAEIAVVLADVPG